MTDIVFKKVFGVPANTELLKALVNSCVLPEDAIDDITILNPYTIKDHENDKGGILDIRAQGTINMGRQNKRMLNVEIQVVPYKDYTKRALFYWGKVYTESIGSGDSFTQLCKTIGIHFLNFDVSGEPDYHNVYRALNINTHNELSQDFEIHTVELQKFWKQHSQENTYNNDTVKKLCGDSTLAMWIAFLCRPDCLEKDNPLRNDLQLKKALQVLDEMHHDAKERKIIANQRDAVLLQESRNRSQKEAALRFAARGVSDVDIIESMRISEDELAFWKAEGHDYDPQCL